MKQLVEATCGQVRLPSLEGPWLHRKGSVCLKEQGGLNILWNQAAICKLLWALRQHKEKLWIAWVHTYYIKKQNLFTMEVPNQTSWIVKKILNMRKIWQKLGTCSDQKGRISYQGCL